MYHTSVIFLHHINERDVVEKSNKILLDFL